MSRSPNGPVIRLERPAQATCPRGTRWRAVIDDVVTGEEFSAYGSDPNEAVVEVLCLLASGNLDVV